MPVMESTLHALPRNSELSRDCCVEFTGFRRQSGAEKAMTKNESSAESKAIAVLCPHCRRQMRLADVQWETECRDAHTFRCDDCVQTVVHAVLAS